MKRLSLSETARRFGINKGYLSRRVHAGKPAKGHDLHLYAAMQDGKICGFDLPESMIPSPEEKSASSQDQKTEQRLGNGENVASNVASVSSDEEESPSMIEINVDGDALTERANPAGGAISEALMEGAFSGATREIVSETLQAIRQSFEDADPGEAMAIGRGVKSFLLDIAPLVGGSAVGYQYRDRHPVTMVAAALLAGAGIELLVKGDDSRFVQAFKSGFPSTHDRSKSQQLQSGVRDVAEDFIDQIGDGMARDEMAGDGVSMEMEPALSRHDSENESQSSSK